MNRQTPRLKNGVDLQLQSAFQDSNWPVVIRLAEKRARTLNDQYYEIVKICAESQLDDPIAKFAGVTAIWQFVKDGTVVKDVDAIDLLEWATHGMIEDEDFAASLGTLRVRAVKASPKDKIGATRCLESCLLHWDLNGAQQIAAVIDRSCPNERSFLFWNIVITHMLSISSQSPPEKKKLYGTLAQKQIERAAQATEQAATESAENSPKAPARGIQTEEEVLLLYEIVETHGTAEDLAKLLKSSVFSPVKQFNLGRKELFQRIVEKHRRDGEWEAMFNLCRDCLSEKDEDGQPILLASDIVIWRHFIFAASQLKGVNTQAGLEVRDLLTKVMTSKNMRPMYRRNLLLARVSAAFGLAPSDGNDLEDGRPSSTRLRELLNYIDDQSTSLACFNDVKGFIEQLDAPGRKFVAYEHLKQICEKSSKEHDKTRIQLLSLKTQYLIMTCSAGSSSRCTVCDERVDMKLCQACLSQIHRAAVDAYSSLGKTANDDEVIKTEILPELAILIVYCSLTNPSQHLEPADTSSIPFSLRSLLHAVALLESQLCQNPGHSQVSLLLVQVYIFLGSPYRASEIWEAIGVKRTIVDSLASIFYDRLSTVSPSLLSVCDDWGWQLMDLVTSHYHVSLKLRMPRRLIDSFEAGSYSSVIGMPKYMEDLRMSCTRAMSLAEGMRTSRLCGEVLPDMLADPRINEMLSDGALTPVVDYGSFPAWAASSWKPLHESLRIGPAPSSCRSRLTLLSETFHGALSYKPPSSYKVSTIGSETDQVYLLEHMNRLSNSFSNHLASAITEVTPSELIYFEAISLLSTLIPLCVGIDRTAALPSLFDDLINALKASLSTLRMEIVVGEDLTAESLVRQVSSMHGVAMLHDAATAIKKSTQWILGFNEQERERDKSGKTTLPKEVVSKIKALQLEAESSIKHGQGLVAKLSVDITSRDFESKLRQWAFDGQEYDERILIMDDISMLVEGWATNIKGWKKVDWS